MVALSLSRNLSWNPGKGPCEAVGNRSWPCPSPQKQAVCGAGGALRRTEMKLLLSARIHTPKPRITAPRICKERHSQRKPRTGGSESCPSPKQQREG